MKQMWILLLKLNDFDIHLNTINKLQCGYNVVAPRVFFIRHATFPLTMRHQNKPIVKRKALRRYFIKDIIHLLDQLKFTF